MIPRRHLVSALLLGVMAASLVGCNSDATSPTSPIDNAPPQAPTNLHSSTDASINRDWLVWDASASASVAGYEIHVSAGPGATSSLLASVDASSTDLLLPLVGENTTEYYRVRAIGTNDVPSAFTGSVSVERIGWEGMLPKSDPGRGTEGDF